MVIKEFRCAAHGYFESGVEKPSCPKGGCTTVTRVFLTAPSIKGDSTKQADANLRQIALDFGLSDMRSARTGETARIKTKEQREAEDLQQKLRHRFAPLAVKGGTFNTETKQITGSGLGALGAIAQHGAKPTDVVTQAKETFIRPVHSVTDFQHATIVKRDPDKDSVARVKAA